MSLAGTRHTVRRSPPAKSGNRKGSVQYPHARFPRLPGPRRLVRVVNYPSNGVSCLSGFPGHRATFAEQSMELENLELDLLYLFEKLHPALLEFIPCNLNCAK